MSEPGIHHRQPSGPCLDRAEVMRLLEGAQARLGDDLRPDSRARITARLRDYGIQSGSSDEG